MINLCPPELHLYSEDKTTTTFRPLSFFIKSSLFNPPSHRTFDNDTMLPSTNNQTGILILHGLATANRYRVIRLVDARRKIENLEPFQQDDKRVIRPSSEFAQEGGCFPCWTCPDLDNDPARINHPTAASNCAFCCDDMLLEQREVHHSGAHHTGTGASHTSELHNGHKPNPNIMMVPPPSMYTNIQPNTAMMYSSPPQPPHRQPLTTVTLQQNLVPLYPTKMGAPW